MVFPPRLHIDGASYHVTARGDNRELIFNEEADYKRYLTLLGRYKNRFQFTMHAYALMPNHVHLILQPGPDAVISQIMQCLTIAYTRYFNQRYRRVGHVFQGRFFSRWIETEAYLLVASRYVHLNPVRAKLTKRAIDYPWSSYGAYLTGKDPWHLAYCSTIYNLIGASSKHVKRVMAYREFVETDWTAGPSPEERAYLKGMNNPTPQAQI